MIKAQRKSHRYIWLLLAFLLPGGIVCGWMAVPVSVHSKLQQPETAASLPHIVSTVKKSGYTVTLKSDEAQKHWQLEWTDVSPVTTPSSLIYQAAGRVAVIDSSTVVGRVAERGTYRFNVEPAAADQPFHFIVYDIIHHRILDRIDIKP